MSKQELRYVDINKVDGHIEMSIKNVSEFAPSIMKGDKLATYSYVHSKVSRVVGQVLTVIDASIIDPKQNKAMKDLIRGIVSDFYCEVSGDLFDQEEIQRQATEAMDNGTIEEVDVLDMLQEG